MGKLLTPFLVVFLAALILKGIASPLGNIGAAQFTDPLSRGFIEGYNTMDALASVIFGLVIVKSIRAKGVTDSGEIARATLHAGLIAAFGLSALYLGLSYLGATTGTTYAGNNPGEMLSFLAGVLLGPTGKLIISLTITLACLTTSIGLISSCGTFFSRLTNNKISYNAVCIITVLVSALLANLGDRKSVV